MRRSWSADRGTRVIGLLVIVGGGFGAIGRLLLTVSIGSTGRGFPLGTVVVNVVGSFALGLIVGSDLGIPMTGSDPVAIGFLGGFTTFSTWMHDIDRAEGRRLAAAVVGIPIVLGFGAAATGVVIGSTLLR